MRPEYIRSPSNTQEAKCSPCVRTWVLASRHGTILPSSHSAPSRSSKGISSAIKILENPGLLALNPQPIHVNLGMNATDSAHLLVVDDDARLRSLLQRFLTAQGFRVTTAADAAEARALIKSIEFDCLILDVMMPGENGFDLASDLRAQFFFS